MKIYTQLTMEQRYQIYALKKTGHTLKKTSDVVGVDKSTISRELSRNSGQKGYRPRQAHQKALVRRAEKSTPRLLALDWALVEKLLKFDLSPEQVSERLFQEKKIRISHEWIYQYIYQNKASGGDIYRHLRCQKKRRKRYGSYDRRGQPQNRIFIDKRPSVVEMKKRVGDWEGDTIIGGNHKGVITTMVERKTLYTVIDPIRTKNAINLREKLVGRMKPYKERIHTITFDNGKEFSEHKGISQDLGASIYFAHPYSSWERGLNENTNGLIRQYFPKKTDLSRVTREEADYVMNRLNFRPRKKLAFKTPYEVFFKTKINLTDQVALNT